MPSSGGRSDSRNAEFALVLLLVVGIAPFYASAATTPTSGFSLTVAFPPGVSEAGYALAASLSTTGLEVIPVQLSWPEVYSRVFALGSANYSEGGFDSFLLYQPTPPAVDPLDPEYSLVNETPVVSNLTQFSETANASYLMAAERAIVHDYYEIPLFYLQPIWAANSSLKGVNPTASSYFPKPWEWSGLTNVTFLSYGERPSTVLPMFGSSGLPAYAVFQPLVIPSGDGYSPCLAVNWSGSGNTWYVYLRRGVIFQNGAPMTADDVVWSIKAVLDPLTSSPLRAFYESVLGESVKLVLANGTTYFVNGSSAAEGEVAAVGNYEVKFQLPRPFSLFYPLFLSQVFVYPMGQLAKIGDFGLATSAFSRGSAAVGTGPYQLVSVSGNGFELKAFNGYWNGTPTVKYLRVEFSEESPASALQSVKAGVVQLMSYDFFPYSLYGKYNESVKWLVGQPDIYVALMLNLNSPFFGTGSYLPASRLNPLNSGDYARDVREAISYSIPRAYLCTSVFKDFAVPASLPLTPIQASYYGLALPAPLAYNLSRSKELTSEAGYNLTTGGIAFTAWPSSLNSGDRLSIFGYLLYNGTPVPGAVISVTAGAPFKQVAKAVTSQNGTFQVSLVPPSGTYYLKLAYPGNETSAGLIPPLSSAVQGPIKVTNFWEANAIYFVALAVVVLLAAVISWHAVRREKEVS